MALILYPSGVLKDYKANHLVFTDQEIIALFDGYKNIRTKRLLDIPNTWMIWGESDNNPADTFSNIGASIVEEEIFSPLLFIHDTEIDPNWMMVDEPILFNYEHFIRDLRQFIDDIANDIIMETRERNPDAQNLVILKAVGPTNDNRILFDFNPHVQSQDFWSLYFPDFAEKTNKFLLNNQGKAFRNLGVIIFEDRKIVIRILHEDFEYLIRKLIDFGEKEENYEWCSFLKDFLKRWQEHVNSLKND